MKKDTIVVLIRLLIYFIFLLIILSCGMIYHRNYEINSLLLKACESSNLETVNILLFAMNADPNTTDASGFTPLMSSSEAKSINLVKTLITAGANVNIKAKDGTTALMLFSGKKAPEIVDLLILHGAEIDVRNCGGMTALMFAVALSDDIRNAEILLKHGANINAKDLLKMTPLMIACKVNKENIDLVNLLFKFRPEINELSLENKTALDYAIEHKNLNVINLLRKYGAKTSTELRQALEEQDVRRTMQK